MDSKPFWQSKTLWFNVLTGLLIIASNHGFNEFQADPNIQVYAQVAETAVVMIGNIILRFITKQPVS